MMTQGPSTSSFFWPLTSKRRPYTYLKDRTNQLMMLRAEIPVTKMSFSSQGRGHTGASCREGTEGSIGQETWADRILGANWPCCLLPKGTQSVLSSEHLIYKGQSQALATGWPICRTFAVSEGSGGATTRTPTHSILHVH